jgi:hypothetical protein
VIPISFIGKATYRIIGANTATLVGDIAFQLLKHLFLQAQLFDLFCSVLSLVATPWYWLFGVCIRDTCDTECVMAAS